MSKDGVSLLEQLWQFYSSRSCDGIAKALVDAVGESPARSIAGRIFSWRKARLVYGSARGLDVGDGTPVSNALKKECLNTLSLLLRLDGNSADLSLRFTSQEISEMDKYVESLPIKVKR